MAPTDPLSYPSPRMSSNACQDHYSVRDSQQVVTDTRFNFGKYFCGKLPVPGLAAHEASTVPRKQIFDHLRLIVGPHPVERNQSCSWFHGVASNLKERQGLIVVEVMKYAQCQDNVEVVRLDPIILAHALAYEPCLGEAASGLVDVFRADIETDIFSILKVGHHGSRSASDVQNAIAWRGTNVVSQ